MHGLLNAYWQPLTFEWPPVEGGRHEWRRRIDAALPSPFDIYHWDEAPSVREST
jgi:isoamylase